LPDQPVSTCPRLWTDTDTLVVQDFLQREANLPQIGHDAVQHGLELVADTNRYHPVRDWLNGLTWDGTERLERWLITYACAEDTPYARAIGKLFLTGMVARVMRPGCKMDYMLILEGEQGLLKSQLLRTLAGPWFSDQIPALHRREASQHLRGVWLVEVAELDMMARADLATLNAFITRTVETYFPRYGRSEAIEPRQCVLAGTTNAAVYLRDPTGGRRFWGVPTGKTGPLRPRKLAQDRNQLFAEAVAAYRNGASWWPTREFEAAHVQPEQDQRYASDLWEDLLPDALDQWAVKNPVSNMLEVVLAVLVTQGLHADPLRWSPREQQRLTGCLRRLGWQPRSSHGRRWWERKP
jgi:predicted P-loop ATPase